MDDDFEAHRPHLRAVAYRMLGSFSEAEDAVQETWLRMARADTSEVHNLRAWLTTVVGRVSLDMLRARKSRREDPLDTHVPDPVVTAESPEDRALLADSVGLALLVVLDTLAPNERLAFVLHDIFAVPFEQIAQLLDRSPAAAKQLASRARRRLRDTPAVSNVPTSRHRELVDAFRAAAGGGDFDGLLAVLDPDVVLRADAGAGPFGPSHVVRGAAAVVGEARRFVALARHAHPVLVNGQPGFLVSMHGRPMSVISTVVRDDKIVQIDILADPDRLGHIDPAALGIPDD